MLVVESTPIEHDKRPQPRQEHMSIEGNPVGRGYLSVEDRSATGGNTTLDVLCSSRPPAQIVPDRLQVRGLDAGRQQEYEDQQRRP